MSQHIDIDDIHAGPVADRRAAPDPESLVLHRENALLLLVDIQEKLAKGYVER